MRRRVHVPSELPAHPLFKLILISLSYSLNRNGLLKRDLCDASSKDNIDIDFSHKYQA